MRLLWLGGSNDDYGPIPEADRGFSIARRMLAEAARQEVDLVRKRIWPTPALPPLVDRWTRESEPDVVYLKANSYWVCYEAVGARALQRWGTSGSAAVRRGQRVLGERWMPEGPLMRTGRSVARKVIGTATYFEAAQVIATFDDLLHIILRRENAAVVVRGGFPPVFAPSGGPARGLADARFAALQDGLAALCARLHISFLDDERGLGDDEVRALKEPDLTHPNRAGHARTGLADGKALVDAWRALNTEPS